MEESRAFPLKWLTGCWVGCSAMSSCQHHYSVNLFCVLHAIPAKQEKMKNSHDSACHLHRAGGRSHGSRRYYWICGGWKVDWISDVSRIVNLKWADTSDSLISGSDSCLLLTKLITRRHWYRDWWPILCRQKLICYFFRPSWKPFARFVSLPLDPPPHCQMT